MNKQIIGLDAGTNSLGFAIRESNEYLENQITKKGVLLFDKGVASEKGNEYPKVQKRTESRGKRRNYQAEKYRKYNLLEFLIKNGMCPLTIEELDEWRKYSKGKPRKYPQSKKFINWIRYDFDGDGKPDFHVLDRTKHDNLFVFRAFAIDAEFKPVFDKNPELLGRVFYHLIQRRGFKGRDEFEAETMMKGSETADTPGRNQIEEYLNKYKSLGAALYHFQKENGGRIRKRYNLRSDYESELKLICKVHGLGEEQYKKLWKAIIWQRPLRTQKGMVGLCTFEKNKRRVAAGHPLYLEFKTWVFINNLKIEPPKGADTVTYLRANIYPLFLRKSDFELSKILDQLKKDNATMLSGYADSKMAKTKVSALGLFYDFTKIFGEDWRVKFNFDDILNRPPQTPQKASAAYVMDDIWHVLHTFDSKEKLEEFGVDKLGLDSQLAKEFANINLTPGYATLSLSAIKRMLPYLQKGISYVNAVYLANMPRVLGVSEITESDIDYFIEEIDDAISDHAELLELNVVVNGLMKSVLSSENRYSIEDERELTMPELNSVSIALNKAIGEVSWSELSKSEQDRKTSYVSNEFKKCLMKPSGGKNRLFMESPRRHTAIFELLKVKYDVPDENIKHLWHPSEQEVYPKAKEYREYTINGKSVYI
jgi:CRISPR-associated endonuclease Csn1